MYELPHRTPNSRLSNMPNRLWVAALVAATPLVSMSRIAPPVKPDAGCVLALHGARSEQRSFMRMMRSHAAKDAAKLARYKVEDVRPSDVELVTDDDVCERAASAYSNVLRNAKADRRVTVLQVGNRYVVRDPDFKPDKHRRSVTFDSNFAEVLAIVID